MLGSNEEVPNSEKNFVQLEFILKCLNILHDCLEDEDESQDKGKSIPEQVEEGVAESILVWYHYILDKMPSSPNDSFKVKNLTQLVRLILSDLKDGGPCQTLQRLFVEELNIDYCKIAFTIYDTNVSSSSKVIPIYPSFFHLLFSLPILHFSLVSVFSLSFLEVIPRLQKKKAGRL